MTVVQFPKKHPKIRRSRVAPEAKVCEAVNELIDSAGPEEAFHALAEIAEKLRRNLRKLQKQRKT
jgi:ribosome-associated translation inhibitor RaiA